MKLVKILPDKIQIRTDDTEFKNARLNDLISVSDGEAELVTMITAITDNDVETQMDENAIMEELEQPSLKVIECSILGSVSGGEFKQQIDQYPSTDVKIHKISDFEFGAILAADSMLKGNSDFQIGDYAGYDVPAWLDGNKFYQRHSCIVGNTGCGGNRKAARCEPCHIRYSRGVQPVILCGQYQDGRSTVPYLDAWICGHGGECVESERGQHGGYVGIEESVLRAMPERKRKQAGIIPFLRNAKLSQIFE